MATWHNYDKSLDNIKLNIQCCSDLLFLVFGQAKTYPCHAGAGKKARGSNGPCARHYGKKINGNHAVEDHVVMCVCGGRPPVVGVSGR